MGYKKHRPYIVLILIACAIPDMKRLLLQTFTLTVLFFLVTSAAMLIGHEQPVPEQVSMLHLGEMCQLPCWIGITPGKTRVSEARLIIAQIYNHGNPLTFDP